MTIYWYEDIAVTPVVDKFLTGVEVSVQASELEVKPGLRRLAAASGTSVVVVRKWKMALEIVPDDSSYRYRALMERPTLNLKFSLPRWVDIPVGAWTVFQGQTFYLGEPANFKKQGERNYEYTLTMGTLEDGMTDYKFRNMVDGRLKWSMCAKPAEFLQYIVDNLNERDGEGVWSYDATNIVDASEKTIEFNHTYIWDALKSVADEFDTEFEISEDFVISLHKVEYFKDTPLALAYGRGNGFIPGVGRSTQSDEKPIKRLYTEGGEQNIDRSVYGGSTIDENGNTVLTTEYPYKTSSAELLLPSAQNLKYDGTHFEGDKDASGKAVTLDAALTRTYQTDENGYYVERVSPTLDAVKEDSLDCSEIYPKFVGKVAVVSLGSENNALEAHFYDFTNDQTQTPIPDSLNFNDCIIEGESMTIVFQTGMLAGKEFECKYDHTNRKWKLVPQEIDGILMPDPDTGYMMQLNDEYAVFGISLPKAYICDDATKTGASWEMFKEAVKYLYEHEEQKFTFTGELQALWAKRNWANVGGYLKVGGYVLFTDNQFAPDGVKIRITGIKDYITKPYSPTVEISNSVSAGSSVSSDLRDIENVEVVIENTKNQLISFTKRRFRDAKETAELLAAAALENFTESISPITVQSMSLLVGDESLQFVLLDSAGEVMSTPVTVTGSTLHVNACTLKHMTMGVNSITASRPDGASDAGPDATNLRTWTMTEYESSRPGAESGAFYLYAYCNRSVGYGGFLLTTKPVTMTGAWAGEADPNASVYNYNYYFLVGILNSEVDGERSFVSLYGFTEILPGRITTDRLVSTDGESWIDLSKGAMALGDALVYNQNDDKTLRLKFLTSENSNLGGWIFKDNRLISQVGTVNGVPAEYTDVESGGKYAGLNFIPNISMDGTTGQIKQGENILIDENGVSLLNDDGEVVAQFTNDTIGDVDNIADSKNTVKVGISASVTHYQPHSGTYRQTLHLKTIDLGTLTAGTLVSQVGAQINVTVPAMDNGYEGKITFEWLQIRLLKGTTEIATLVSATKSTAVVAGATFSMKSAAEKSVTIPEDGEYSIRVSLTVDYYCEHSGTAGKFEFSSQNNYEEYSFEKYGYKRTIIGNGGFYTSWAQNQYLVANSSSIRMRHGNAVIKLSNDGLQKSTDGGNTFTSL